MKVKLLVDLSKYHESLVPNVIGETIKPLGKRSKERPNVWISVQFEHYALDVLVKQLEAIRPAPQKKDGPVMSIQSKKPPKIGQEISLKGMTWKIIKLVDRQGVDKWLVQLVVV